MSSASSVVISNFKGCRAPSKAVLEKFKSPSVFDQLDRIYRDRGLLPPVSPLFVQDHYKYELQPIDSSLGPLYLSFLFFDRFLPTHGAEDVEFRNLAQKHIKTIDRPLLESRCIRYLKEDELKNFRITKKEGNEFYYEDKRTIEDAVYMFALNKFRDRNDKLSLFIAKKERNTVHHSSFFKDQPVLSAGIFEFKRNQIVLATNHSGHYEPSLEHLYIVREYLASLGVDVNAVEWRCVNNANPNK